MVDTQKITLTDYTVDIVSAYVSNNTLAISDVSQLISTVHSALQRLSDDLEPSLAPDMAKPAVSVRKSITPDYLICLEDGKEFRSLKRHLRTHYNLSPEEYREKWGLPADYPMVAPSYAEKRSSLALKMGLGQKRKNALPHRTKNAAAE
jgi:predicted transcriptional regulator